jgi:mercuric ion transport protein
MVRIVSSLDKLGLGFLSQLEGLAINTLLPPFATIALLVNFFGWFQHRIHWRGILSVLGPMSAAAR